MGFMYVTPLEKAATYIPQEVLNKLQGKDRNGSGEKAAS
jgi:hypothetical protein